MNIKILAKKSLVALTESRILDKFFAASRNRHVPIFMLHRFDDAGREVQGHSIDFLRNALTWIQENNYNVISLDHLIDALDGVAELPERAVVFTVDDGFIEQVDLAAKVFEEFGFPVSIFLISDFSSEKSWPWDYQVEYILNRTLHEKIVFNVGEETITIALTTHDNSRQESITAVQDLLKGLTTDQAIEYAKNLAHLAEVKVEESIPASYFPVTWAKARASESDNVRFGPHSTQHAILKRQSNEISLQEIADSKAAVEKELTLPLNIFCYPTGRKNIDFGQREMDTVKALGMRAGLSVTPGYVDIHKHGSDEDRYCLPRFGFPSDMNDFIQLCSWVELLKEKLRGNL
jgi:peptidoglycan/xylan/chitin deacetylase (PgdA/CDA1 family)